jgi:hypothetical protein
LLVGALSLGDLSVLLLAAFDHAFHQLIRKIARHKQALEIIEVTPESSACERE